MKTIITNTLIIIGGMLLSATAFSQTERVWVTVENTTILPQLDQKGNLASTNVEMQRLISDFNIKSVTKAFPSSRQAQLQKVYEMECECDALALTAAISNGSKQMSRPEVGPNYELMYDPNDYDVIFNGDYALDNINAKQAWNFSTGNPNVVIGISDGNYYTSHEELQGQFVNYDANNTSTLYNHGTAVAITAAGRTDNSAGKSSIGFKCKMSLVGLGYNRVLQLSYAGARVINLSWASGCSYSSYAQSVINEVYANGSICVASAGNGGTCGGASNFVYPASFDHVISVTSVGPSGNHERIIGNSATTHQHNSMVDISAPGYDVAISIAPGNYSTGNGTSFAAPYVSGTIGLMLSVSPCLTFEEVQSILKLTANKIDIQNPSYIGLIGAGQLDAGAAVKRASLVSCAPIVDEEEEEEENGGGTIGGGNGTISGGNTNSFNDVHHGNTNGNNGNHGNGNNGNGNGNNGNGNGNNGGNGNHGNGNNGNGNDNGNNGGNGNHGNGNNGNGVGRPGLVSGGASIIESEENEAKGQSNSTNEFKPQIRKVLEIQMYPNPTMESAVISWKENPGQEIRILDSRGALIERVEIHNEMNEYSIQLQERGMYFIQIYNEGTPSWNGKLTRM